MNTFRGFIAIDIKCSPSILGFINDLKKTPVQLKMVEPENIHLTLKFLGDTKEKIIPDIEELMKQSTEDIPPFEVNLQGAGVFPNKNYITIIWIGMEKKQELTFIAEKLDELLQNLGYKKERRPFSPHVTVARVKRIKEKNALLSLLEEYRETDFGKLKVDSIKLKKSDLTPKGPIYTTIREIKLR
ncbi:MAG TPA: RNA 2',3'-cyclic phosphodiesterase [Thermoplasmata archaeon]|nr:RNA 2',3'-cyclic phosphodiesterase [Thermoplasmata archaeon]